VKSRVQTLDFSEEERRQYENTKKILLRIIKQRVGEYEKHSKFGLFQANLQMRIMCNHGTYQLPFSWQRRSCRDEREAALSAIGSNAEITCSGCRQPMPIQGSNRIYNSFIEDCAHVLCSECLEESERLSTGNSRQHCPICMAHSNALAVASQTSGSPVVLLDGAGDVEMPDVQPSATNGEEDDDHYFNKDGYSTKMEALIKDVRDDLWASKR